MIPSADLCRRQQAAQLHRAESASLPNVREVARKAAAAWGVEALYAEGREPRTHLRADAREAERLACEQLDCGVRENPDRGRADRPLRLVAGGGRS